MAKIVLRTNIANKNFTVEHKVIDALTASNTVELTISPRQGYSIKANDFISGYLPAGINGIHYIDYGDNKVKAVVSLSPEIKKRKSNINISLPISGVTTVLEDSFTLVEACTGDDINIITNSSSSYQPSVGVVNEEVPGETFHVCGCDSNGESIKVDKVKNYSIKNELGTKTLVLSRRFITPENYYFPKEPTYTITGNNARYTVVSKLHKDKNNRITYKNFDVYYTSPQKSTTIGNIDTICFSAKPETILDGNLEEGKSLRNKIATKQEEYKIYSFNTGETVTAKGGVKRIEIKGVPGTPFKIITQNNAKQTYNFKTGVFEAGGGMLSGVIPPAKPNVNYGAYTTLVKIAKSTTTDTISTRLITDQLIDHSDRKKQAALITGKVENKIVPNTKFTLTFQSTGFTIPSDSPITVGPGRYQQPFGVERIYSTRIYPVDLKTTIRIIRQPLHDIDAIYYNWDSAYGTDTIKVYNSAGKAIKTDWNVSGNGTTPDNTEAKYIIQTTAKGGGRVVLDDINGDSYQYIDLKVVVSGVIFGTADVTPELDLLNFLTLV